MTEWAGRWAEVQAARAEVRMGSGVRKCSSNNTSTAVQVVVSVGRGLGVAKRERQAERGVVVRGGDSWVKCEGVHLDMCTCKRMWKERVEALLDSMVEGCIGYTKHCADAYTLRLNSDASELRNRMPTEGNKWRHPNNHPP